MKSARFDWYQATIQTSADELAAWLSEVYPFASRRPCKPKNGAAQAFQIEAGGMRIVEAIWGGAMDGYGVNAWASGHDAHEFAQALRQRFPVHRVTRADVCVDVDSPGAWEWAYRLLSDYAERFKLETHNEGDYHKGERGRSFYIGGRQSVVRLVAYEKGKQIAELGMPNLVRLELRVKPKDRISGQTCAMVPAAGLFGCSAWSKELGDYLMSEEDGMQRVVIGTRWTRSDRERALQALVKQYGGKLGELCSELGSWEEVGAEIGRRIREVEVARESCIRDIKRVRQGTFTQVPLGTSTQGSGVESAGGWGGARPIETTEVA